MFEYDPDKSAANFAKHGIDFDTAQTLWRDDDRVDGPLASHPEQRSMIVGMIDGKLWSAVVTRRGEAVRIISVRRSRPREAAQYDRRND